MQCVGCTSYFTSSTLDDAPMVNCTLMRLRTTCSSSKCKPQHSRNELSTNLQFERHQNSRTRPSSAFDQPASWRYGKCWQQSIVFQSVTSTCGVIPRQSWKINCFMRSVVLCYLIWFWLVFVPPRSSTIAPISIFAQANGPFFVQARAGRLKYRSCFNSPLIRYYIPIKQNAVDHKRRLLGCLPATRIFSVGVLVCWFMFSNL